MKRLIGCAILLFSVVGIWQYKKNATPKPTPVLAREPRVVKIGISGDIEKARKLLSKVSAGFTLDKKRKKVVAFDVLLAVKRANNPVEVIRLKDGIHAPQGFVATVPKKLNGVNTRYEVGGCTVLALKRVVRMDGGFKEVVYTPYTKGIDTPELRKAGLEYLKDKLEQGQNDLRGKNVRSLAYDGLVADTIPKNVAFTLALIEHIDPSHFNAGVPVEELIGKVLVVLATNREDAYRYSVSKAGARGQFQFMPKTYAMIEGRYPSAKLTKNFVSGMDNHVNAAKATLLLFDSDLSRLTKAHRTFLKKNPEAMGKYLAAAYNGGPGKAAKAIKQYGWKWESHVFAETRTYLKEFGAVWKVLYS